MNQSNLKFRVESSAINSILTPSLYASGSVWSSYSSNVNVSIVIAAPGMPYTGFYHVVGHSYPSYNNKLGQMIPYDSSGNIVSADSSWYSVTILMNSDPTAFDNANSPSGAAKKTFIHEVGHALKLAHPTVNSSLSNHIYSGKPRAVMNQNFPNAVEVASNLVDHDIINLQAKWGA